MASPPPLCTHTRAQGHNSVQKGQRPDTLLRRLPAVCMEEHQDQGIWSLEMTWQMAPLWLLFNLCSPEQCRRSSSLETNDFV